MTIQMNEIFELDEMRVYGPSELEHMETEDILNLHGIVHLKDLVPVLSIHMKFLNKTLKDLDLTPKERYQRVGMAKLWNQWIVRMSVFSQFFRDHRLTRSFTVRHIPKDWDSNRLMHEEGIFPLTQVCRKLPFSARQLRYRSHLEPDSLEKYGIWKDAELNQYLVDMAVLSKWIASLWEEPEPPEKSEDLKAPEMCSGNTAPEPAQHEPLWVG